MFNFKEKIMLKTKTIFICFLLCIVSSVCYAGTYTVPVSIKCSSSIPEAGWKQIAGDPRKQLTLTTEGVYIKGEGLVRLWDDDDNYIYHSESVGDTALVRAQCLSFSQSMKMYDFETGDNPPVLVCPKGDGIKMRFISPNNSDPEQYVYHATLTVVEDDEPLEKSTIEVKTQESSKDPVSKFDVTGQQTFTSTSKSMGKSSGGGKPSKCIIMSGEPDYCMYNSLLKLVSLSSFISP